MATNPRSIIRLWFPLVVSFCRKLLFKLHLYRLLHLEAGSLATRILMRRFGACLISFFRRRVLSNIYCLFFIVFACFSQTFANNNEEIDILKTDIIIDSPTEWFYTRSCRIYLHNSLKQFKIVNVNRVMVKTSIWSQQASSLAISWFKAFAFLFSAFGWVPRKPEFVF